MKCDLCPKVATLHVTEIVDGEATERHLCEDCGHTYLENVASPPTEPVTSGGLSESELESLETLICPTCKLTFREFRSQGRLGCADCYTAFQGELVPLLENIHGETQHVGKFPKRTPDNSRRRFELARLRNELRTAVNEENYEQAARLRDEIHILEQDMGSLPDK